MKGKETKKEKKKDKAEKNSNKVQSDYQREKSSKHEPGLQIKTKL